MSMVHREFENIVDRTTSAIEHFVIV